MVLLGLLLAARFGPTVLGLLLAARFGPTRTTFGKVGPFLANTLYTLPEMVRVDQFWLPEMVRGDHFWVGPILL